MKQSQIILNHGERKQTITYKEGCHVIEGIKLDKHSLYPQTFDFVFITVAPIILKPQIKDYAQYNLFLR